MNLATTIDGWAGKSRYRCIRILNSKYRAKFKQTTHFYTGIINIIIGVFEFMAGFASDIFKFKPLDYEPDNENMCKEVSNQIHSKYEFLPPDWYSIYKLSAVIIREENIKSLSPTYLAKYNFYRSLAFLFLLNTIYIYILYNKASYFISPLGWQLVYPICFTNMVFWLTFHEKYKRYWKLCGNDSLVSLFYFFDRSKENVADGKKDSVS